ncbi:hypothetical protein H0W26_04880, partial [Candidatus Dependentiae bacterium]|nr:hypothetical protein [Candidatus Dependentiae bacterium]
MRTVYKVMFLGMGLLQGSYIQGMEPESRCQPSSIMSAITPIWFFLNTLPREVKVYIISLFLELELNYTYECPEKVGTGDVLAFSPKGDTCITRSKYAVLVCDIKTGICLQKLEGHTDVILPVEYIHASGDGYERIFPYKCEVHSVTFSPDGTIVITTAIEDTAARLWNVKTGELFHILKGHTHNIYSVAFSSDGKTVLTGSDDTTARLWDVHTGKQLRILEHPCHVTAVAMCCDGKTVVTGSAGGKVRLWNAKTGQQLYFLEGHT